MKNLLTVLTLVLINSPLALAASNCVSRVDKHLDKTTAEKVEYCLAEDQEEEDAGPVTEVILTDTYSVQYPKQKQNPAPNRPQERTFKKYSTAPIEMTYTDQKKYPHFRNDIMPSLSAEEANETAMEAFKQQPNSSKTKPAAKKTKPARQVKTQPAAKPAAAKPSAQPVQQAQTLQNDPLATNPTQDGTVPAGFLDDGLMGPADFGYNATDPAMQS